MSLRVSLFIDYMNAYYTAREIFACPSDDRVCGHFWPWEIGEILCSRYRDRYPREHALDLHEVRVYRGEPIRKWDTPGYDAFQRQKTAWEKAGVQVFSSPLQYDPDSEGEKEIDVMLAIDFVVGAIRQDYDVGVLFSFDRDLMPALRFVRENMAEGPRADVAGWGRTSDGKYLQPSGTRPVKHLFSKHDFIRASDSTDYRRKTSRFRTSNQRQRQEKRHR